MTRYDFVIPIRTYSALNERIHWAKRARRVKAERTAAALMCPHFPLPCTVTLTRVGPRLLDDDAPPGAMKAVRDGIADRLGAKDNDPRITWKYEQARGPYAVRVELEAA